jgi:hypothetical protein
LQKAHLSGMSYVNEPFIASGAHNDNYTFVNDLLGLPRLFSSLGAASRQRAEELLTKANSSWTILDNVRSSAISFDRLVDTIIASQTRRQEFVSLLPKTRISIKMRQVA